MRGTATWRGDALPGDRDSRDTRDWTRTKLAIRKVHSAGMLVLETMSGAAVVVIQRRIRTGLRAPTG